MFYFKDQVYALQDKMKELSQVVDQHNIDHQQQINTLGQQVKNQTELINTLLRENNDSKTRIVSLEKQDSKNRVRIFELEQQNISNAAVIAALVHNSTIFNKRISALELKTIDIENYVKGHDLLTHNETENHVNINVLIQNTTANKLRIDELVQHEHTSMLRITALELTNQKLQHQYITLTVSDSDIFRRLDVCLANNGTLQNLKSEIQQIVGRLSQGESVTHTIKQQLSEHQTTLDQYQHRLNDLGKNKSKRYFHCWISISSVLIQYLHITKYE